MQADLVTHSTWGLLAYAFIVATVAGAKMKKKKRLVCGFIVVKKKGWVGQNLFFYRLLLNLN